MLLIKVIYRKITFYLGRKCCIHSVGCHACRSCNKGLNRISAYMTILIALNPEISSFLVMVIKNHLHQKSSACVRVRVHVLLFHAPMCSSCKEIKSLYNT